MPTFHVLTKKQIAFQTYLIELRINHSYLVSQLSSANITPLGFDVQSGYSVEEMRAESVITKTLGSEKKWCITDVGSVSRWYEIALACNLGV